MFFNGDKLYMPSSAGYSQSMGFVLAGKGDVLAIDGGTFAEAENFENLLLSLGGRVDTWFLTHAHYDHIDAFVKILTGGKVKVNSVCFNFPPLDFYYSIEKNVARKECLEECVALIEKRRIPAIKPTKGERIPVGHFTVTPLSDGTPLGPSINSSSVVLRVETSGKPVLFLSDLDGFSEDAVLKDFPDLLRCDIVQVAHHGQGGASEGFYGAVRPKVCLWPTPEWLWNNDAGEGCGTGPYKTLETRKWMEKFGAVNYRPERETIVIE